jgi:hypothetical protein
MKNINSIIMKRLLPPAITVLCLFMVQSVASAQEQFGNTLNAGLGIGGHSGYSRYAGQSLPVFSLNYELDVARSFTLAPFVSFYTYTNRYFWSNKHYTYRETVIPVGVKGMYYFDELFKADSEWDFYAGASLGFAIVSARWESGYDGDRNYFNRGGSAFLDIHVGAEYHFNPKLGLFLDLSSGVSTIGLAFHQSK